MLLQGLAHGLLQLEIDGEMDILARLGLFQASGHDPHLDAAGVALNALAATLAAQPLLQRQLDAGTTDHVVLLVDPLAVRALPARVVDHRRRDRLDIADDVGHHLAAGVIAHQRRVVQLHPRQEHLVGFQLEGDLTRDIGGDGDGETRVPDVLDQVVEAVHDHDARQFGAACPEAGGLVDRQAAIRADIDQELPLGLVLPERDRIRRVLVGVAKHGRNATVDGIG